MAFPVVQATNTGGQSGSVSSHPVTFPAHSAGELLVAFVTIDGGSNFDTITSGWQYVDRTNGVMGLLAWKVAESGSETLTVTTTNTRTSSYQAYRITGADTLLFSVRPESGTNHVPHETFTAEARDYLWLLSLQMDGANVASATPTNYGNLLTETASSATGTSTAYRTVNNQTETPSAWTNPSEQSVMYTCALFDSTGGSKTINRLGSVVTEDENTLSTSLSSTLTIPDGSNRMVVALYVSSNVTSISSATLGGTAGTSIISSATADSARMSLRYWLEDDIPAGSTTLTFTGSGGSGNRAKVLNIMTYENVDQTIAPVLGKNQTYSTSTSNISHTLVEDTDVVRENLVLFWWASRRFFTGGLVAGDTPLNRHIISNLEIGTNFADAHGILSDTSSCQSDGIENLNSDNRRFTDENTLGYWFDNSTGGDFDIAISRSGGGTGGRAGWVEIAVQAGETIDVDAQSFSLTQNAAGVNDIEDVDAASFTFTQQAPSIDESIIPDTKALTLTPLDVFLGVQVDTLSLSLSTLDANTNTTVLVDTLALALSTNDADIEVAIPIDLLTFTLDNTLDHTIISGDFEVIPLVELNLTANAPLVNDIVGVETVNFSINSGEHLAFLNPYTVYVEVIQPAFDQKTTGGASQKTESTGLVELQLRQSASWSVPAPLTINWIKN